MYHTRAACATLPQQIHEPTYQPGDIDEGKVNAIHVMHPNLEKNTLDLSPCTVAGHATLHKRKFKRNT